MPRNPIGAVAGFVLGSVLFAAGAVVVAWVIAGLRDIEDARRWAYRAASESPRDLAWWLRDVGDKASADGMVFFGIAGGVLLLLGHQLLGAFRVALRTLDVSDDGLARIRVASPPPRPGRAFEGDIRMKREPRADEAFTLALECIRREGTGSDASIEKAYSVTVEAKPAPGAQGLRIPFRFDVPEDAPATSYSLLASGGYRWGLAVKPVKGMFPQTSTFDLKFEPAPGSSAASPEASVDAIDEKMHALLKRPLQPREREWLRRLPPRALKTAADVARKPYDAFMWLVVGYFVLDFTLPALGSLAAFAMARLRNAF